MGDCNTLKNFPNPRDCDPNLDQTKLNDLLPLTIDGVLDDTGSVEGIYAYVKVAKDLKHLCFFLKKLISRQREAPESASFNLIPITHNIKGLDVQICRRGSPGGEI